MKVFVWDSGMSLEETKDGAYWERNMLALMLAKEANMFADEVASQNNSGWYVHGEYEGWSRVISIFDGRITFHVPDDFDLGDLPQIEPNWDGHSTRKKWEMIMELCGCEPELAQSAIKATESPSHKVTAAEAFGNDCPNNSCS